MMKTRLQIGWLVAGLAAVAVLLVVVAFAIGVSAGPDEPAPGPEEYHIYDGREGIQTQAEVINASRAVAIVEDPAYSDPVTMIVFGMGPTSRYMETYDHNGYVLSKLTTTTKVTASDRRMFRMTDEEGNILAEGEGHPVRSLPRWTLSTRSIPINWVLPSRRTGWPCCNRTEAFSSHKKSPNVFRNENVRRLLFNSCG